MIKSFKYSSHWKTWNRVLHHDARTGLWVELSVSHIKGDWSKPRAEWIRSHKVQPAPADIIAPALPLIVVQSMETVLGKQAATRLLTYDYMAVIDLDKLDLHDKGQGVPLSKVKAFKLP